MTDLLKKYCIKCETENKTYEAWSTTPPTVCPVSTSHVIDASKIEVLSKQTQEAAQTSIIKVFEDENGTQGMFRSETFMFVTEPGISQHIIEMDYNVAIIVSKCNLRDEHINDTFHAFVQPRLPTVGVLEQEALVGSTFVYLSPTAMHNISRGTTLIVNGANVGEVKRVYVDHVELCTPLTNGYPIGAFVHFRVYIIKNYIVDMAGRVSIGEAKIGASLLPTSSHIVIDYINNSMTPKNFIFTIEYLY